MDDFNLDDIVNEEKEKEAMETKNEEREEIRCNVKDMSLYNDNVPFSLSYKIENFVDPKDQIKFIKNVETLVRRANEYRLWVKYISEVLGHTHCGLTDESLYEVSVEIHHHVPSLFIACKAMTQKMIEGGKPFCSLEVADEVLKLHFQNKIGYIPILKSLHEKFHNGFLEIPKELLHGDYDYFIKNFSKYLNDADIETIQERLMITKETSQDYPYSWKTGEYPGA